MQYILHAGDQAQTPRPYDDPGHQITQYRTESELVEQGHRDNGGTEKDGRFLQETHDTDPGSVNGGMRVIYAGSSLILASPTPRGKFDREE